MVSFFDVPVPGPREPEAALRQKWAGPPPGVVPGYSRQRAILFRTSEVILVVDRFLAYPTGVVFTLSLWLRSTVEPFFGPPWELQRRRAEDPLADDFLRFGFQYADGSKWTNLDWSWPGPDEEPTEPVLMGRGGGWGGDAWEMEYWLWPLPPEGPLTFFTAWPAYGIDERSTTVDAAELRRRARDAENLWPGDTDE